MRQRAVRRANALIDEFGSRRRAAVLGLATAVALVVGSGVASGVADGAATSGTITFAYTGAEQVYLVPSGVTMVRVLAVGAGGAAGATSTGGAAPGGLGGLVQGDIEVRPGETLFVEVGGTPDAGSGGFNGGGHSANGGGGGGGASDVRTCSITSSTCAPGNDTLTSRLLVAAGGGGGGDPDSGDIHPGGAGGAAANAGSWAGSPPYEARQGGPGDPGTTSAGGDIAQENNVSAAGSPGVFGAGGAASSVSGEGGGGGGGGWFGGAAGGTSTDGIGGGGGGGGSSYAVAAAQNVSIQTATSAVASVSITPLTPTADLSATAISFPRTQVATVGAARGVAITNNGTAPLQIAGLAPQGTNADDFGIVSSNCGAPVAAGSSCQVVLRFSPLAAGGRAASLVVSAEGVSDQTIALSGTGTVTSPPQTIPRVPAGTEACHGAGGRRCTISFSVVAFGLNRRSGVGSYTLRRGRVVIRGTASVQGGSLQLHAPAHARNGRYLLAIFKSVRTKPQLLRLVMVDVH
jgi:Glycine rich protein